jgi:C4-dicarboxylate transporter DctQ subunit
MVGILSRLDRSVVEIEHMVLFLFSIVMIVYMSVSVFSRYIFDIALAGTEAIPVLLLVWMAMIGASVGMQRGSHFRLTILVDSLPPPAKVMVLLAVDVATAFFVAVLLYKGVELIPLIFPQRSFGIRVSMGWFYLAVPVGATLMLFHVAVRFSRVLTGHPSEEPRCH